MAEEPRDAEQPGQPPPPDQATGQPPEQPPGQPLQGQLPLRDEDGYEREPALEDQATNEERERGIGAAIAAGAGCLGLAFAPWLFFGLFAFFVIALIIIFGWRQ